MRQKNSTFKFKKKQIKSFKNSENQNKLYIDDNYSKIISDFLEKEKSKEESKNNYINNNNESFKIKKVNKVKLSSNSSNRIMKINVIGENKNHKKNNNDIYNNNLMNKERKTANIKKITGKMIQSISEKNITYNKNQKDISKSNTNTNLNLHSLKKKIDASNNIIKMNIINNMNQLSKLKSNHNNINKERKNKSMDKRKEKKIKVSDKKTNNLRININDMFNYKKPSYQIKHYYKNNKTNITKNNNNNKKLIKNNKPHISPENMKINTNNVENSNVKEKNKEFIKKTKKINTELNSSSRMFNLKKQKKIIENSSSKNITDKNFKLYPLNKNLIDKKSSKNIYLNSSNSKINNISNQQLTFKRIKVESVKIDLMNPPKNFSFISQEKLNSENQINDKNNLTLRGTEIPKFINKINNINGYTELSLFNPNDDSNLNRSYRTSFSLNKKSKSRSLSKKREEKKRLKLNHLEKHNEIEENKKKLNVILINLYNIKVIDTKEYIQVKKSEPKKLIDKIRKNKKLQKI